MRAAVPSRRRRSGACDSVRVAIHVAGELVDLREQKRRSTQEQAVRGRRQTNQKKKKSSNDRHAARSCLTRQRVAVQQRAVVAQEPSEAEHCKANEMTRTAATQTKKRQKKTRARKS